MGSGNIPGPSHASYVTIPCIVFFAVTPIFILIRLWSVLLRRSGLGLDDITILIAFTCTLVVQILMMLSVKYGFGQQIANLTPANKLMALELFYVAQIFYKLSVNLTKVSILLLYLRIFVQRWFRICCYVLIGIILSYMVATVCSSIFQCSPIRGAWDKSIPSTCISLTKNWYANAGFSIATDILILLLPMQPLWASKLPLRQKQILMLVFAFGGFGTVTSILRSTTINFSTSTPDTTYDITSTLWTIIEENVGIICSCLPMCRAPLALLFPSIFSNPKSTVNYEYGSGPGASQSHHNTWQQLPGSTAKNSGLNHSMARHNDDESEEYILQNVDKDGVKEGDDGMRAIRKTTQYQVTYESNERKV